MNETMWHGPVAHMVYPVSAELMQARPALEVSELEELLARLKEWEPSPRPQVSIRPGEAQAGRWLLPVLRGSDGPVVELGGSTVPQLCAFRVPEPLGLNVLAQLYFNSTIPAVFRQRDAHGNVCWLMFAAQWPLTRGDLALLERAGVEHRDRGKMAIPEPGAAAEWVVQPGVGQQLPAATAVVTAARMALAGLWSTAGERERARW